MWQEFYGYCKDSRRFCMQGELPNNPALLDWLAVDFMSTVDVKDW
jgi:hypothetical protein